MRCGWDYVELLMTKFDMSIFDVPMFDLHGKVALVSGAAQGLGQATAIALAKFGCDLVLVDRNLPGAEVTAETIRSLGRRVDCHNTNVSSPEAISELFRWVDQAYGQIDFLGNIAGDGVLSKPEELLITDLQRALDNLVIGRFSMCQEAGKRMLKQGRGSYSMAMGAVVQMTRELSTEWSHRGVRVNAVLPAQVLNPSLEARIAEDPNLEKRFLGGIPAGRLGRPTDIMGLAVLLASDASAWITGALIPLDGGNLAMNGGGTPGHQGSSVQTFRP